MSPGLMNLRPTAFLALTLALGGAGCGARASIPEPQSDAGTSVDSGAQRVCVPECTVGHECCVGGCDGPAAEMPSDCCTCLPGEVYYSECGYSCGG